MSSVTAPQVLCKQPWEKRRFQMWFTDLLDTDETIDNIISITAERVGGGDADIVFTDPLVGSTGKYVQVWITEGTHKFRYRIEMRVETTGQQQLEGDGILKVTDS